MAFNFNWSPLIADTSRAREMLTSALNKSPKPPIIVDDIVVTELNLGSTPPELEILEIGDLAEDRFRGIFKLSYAGDAFLTLRTKVQANPLNTYLSAKAAFASPQPLAAASSLTIPLQITLSNIRLSGFVILVFSKQKGITVVFRNDPLESLKVSSTFDSIPFVRDYLQKEIEGQLRVLFMDDLPAIIHRLSLRFLAPDHEELETEDRLEGVQHGTQLIDPLASPPQDAVDAFGNPLDHSQISSISLDASSDSHASFSHKNMLRLSALFESQRTLSLSTPSIQSAVFRASASSIDRAEHSGSATPALTLSSLSRIQSSFANLRSTPSSVVSGSTGNETSSSRPTLCSFSSAPAGLSLASSRTRTHGLRKRKKRIVNLRPGAQSDGSSGASTPASTPAPSAAVSEAPVIPEEREREEELQTPPRTSGKASAEEAKRGRSDSTGAKTNQRTPLLPLFTDVTEAPCESEKKVIAVEPRLQESCSAGFGAHRLRVPAPPARANKIAAPALALIPHSLCVPDWWKTATCAAFARRSCVHVAHWRGRFRTNLDDEDRPGRGAQDGHGQ